MGILDGIVEWIAEQIMYGLDLINTSVLGALGCDMNTFLRYFPAAKTMYSLLVALAIGLILLGWVWNLFKNYGLGLGIEAEDPVRLTAKAILFIVLAYYADEIVNIALTIGGTPYAWILSSELPSLDFASFNSVLLTIIGVCANGGVALIVLILTLILAWNYIMDVDKALIIIRGKNVLEVDKYDYSKHPEAKKLRPSKAASHIPAWQTRKPRKKQASPAPPSQAAAKKPAQKKKPASTEKVVTVTKESIMKKKEDT